MQWTKKSKVLWTAEHDGRYFRIERANSTYTGQAVLREVDDRQRTIRTQTVGGYQEARKVAQTWLQGPE